MRVIRRKLAALAIIAAMIAVLVPTPDASATVFDDEAVSGQWYATGPVWAVDISGDIVYFGGNFSATQNPAGGGSGQGNNVAAISRITGELIDAFEVDVNARVRAIESDGNLVWIGGEFTFVNGQYHPYLVAVDAQTGEIVPTFNAVPNRPVLSLDHAGGRLYASGQFFQVNGQTNKRIVSLDPATGAADPLFVAGANGKVNDVKLSQDGSYLFAGGGFEEIGGAVRDKIATLDPVTGAALPAVFPDDLDGTVRSIAISDDGATVFSANHDNNEIIAYNSTTGAIEWRDKVAGDGQALAFHDGYVYFGFHDPFPLDPNMRMARYSQSGTWDSTWRPTLDTRKGVLAIDVNSDGLAAGGYFKHVNGVFSKAIGVWSDSGGSVVNPDLVAPTTPTGLLEIRNNGNVVKLVWNDDSTDDRFMAGYRIYRDGVRMKEIAENAYNDWNPLNGTVSTYEIRAIDTGGNESVAASVTLTIP